MHKHKALTGVEIKDADQGTVQAVFATFNTVDHDGDVTLPGAFEDGAKVRISAFGHASWGMSRGASSVPMPPVGKGVIRTTETDAILDGQFFLKTQGGRDTFELVKEMDDLQEWSYGYDTLDSEPGVFQGQKVNFLKRQLVHEVSPVMIGAGIDTRTLAVKGKQLSSDLRQAIEVAGRERYGGKNLWVYVDDFDVDESWAVFAVSADDGEQKYLRVSFERDEDGTVELADTEEPVERTTSYRTTKSRESFPDEADRVLGDVKSLITRVEGWGRNSGSKDGRAVSAANRERLAVLIPALVEAGDSIKQLVAESDPTSREDAARELARFVRIGTPL